MYGKNSVKSSRFVMLGVGWVERILTTAKVRLFIRILNVAYWTTIKVFDTVAQHKTVANFLFHIYGTSTGRSCNQKRFMC